MQWSKDYDFSNRTGTTLSAEMVSVDTDVTAFKKVKSKYAIDLNAECKTRKTPLREHNRKFR